MYTEVLPQLDHYASEIATRHAFEWVVVNGQGYAPSERDIYTHDWINIEQIQDSDDEEPISDDEI